jgi:hypothetical protein
VGTSVAQGFGTTGQQVAERLEALAASRRATIPILRNIKTSKRSKRFVRGGADHEVSTGLRDGAAVAPESGSLSPRRSGKPLDLTSRRVYSRVAERYWILRSGEEELRFTHRSGAERWATTLSERGVSSELTWHDEDIASGTPADRVDRVDRVA